MHYKLYRESPKKMKAYFILLTLIGITLFGSPAYTQDAGWELYSTNTAGDKFYYDPQSISKTPPSTIRVRIKAYPVREATIMAGFEQVLEFDCQKRTSRKIESKLTRADGSVQSQSQPVDSSQIVPGTSTENLFEKLCKTMGRRFER
jgi:hypothetical protein